VNVDTKQRPELYDGSKVIARLSFAEEFSARSWAQVSEGIICGAHDRNEWARQLHSIDGSRLVSVCSEEEMRYGLRRESSALD
jgi:hypothetical protein